MKHYNDTILKKVIPIIIDELDPEKIILFGSRAKGNQNPDSDYDILIIKQFSGNHRTYLKNLYLRLYGIGAPIDLLLVKKEVIEEHKNNRFYFYHEALTTGLPLYEKE